MPNVDPVLALELDRALAMRVMQWEAAVVDSQPASRGEAEVLTAGYRYESAADLGRPLHDPAKQAESARIHAAMLERERIH